MFLCAEPSNRSFVAKERARGDSRARVCACVCLCVVVVVVRKVVAYPCFSSRSLRGPNRALTALREAPEAWPGRGGRGCRRKRAGERGAAPQNTGLYRRCGPSHVARILRTPGLPTTGRERAPARDWPLGSRRRHSMNELCRAWFRGLSRNVAKSHRDPMSRLRCAADLECHRLS